MQKSHSFLVLVANLFSSAKFDFIGSRLNNSGLIDLAEYNNYVDVFMLVLLTGGLEADTPK